ncbi:hypothetical protein CTAYLR_006563 [Chrysophaeum taylorii]|uniref:Uncharacterized protein n=1 Tax=Chrysophaeum taylorii TaxID=2483200 RepID=A0AAD7UFH8_9STRA|nr:hypothetical protein CTAYLR_006563 [Chrysophaeum taylorii]
MKVLSLDSETQARIDAIKSTPNLVAPPVPQRPMLPPGMSTKAKLAAIMRYILSFEYNHTGRGYFHLRKDRGLKHVTTTAKEIMREALPIQCVEAVFLGFFLTADMLELERFPLSFKSKSGDRSYRHIVLAVVDTRVMLWGAVGISRRAALQSKEIKFDSLSSLVHEFKQAYASCAHELLKVYVGLPLPHNVHSMEPIKWRVLRLSMTPWNDTKRTLDRYSKDARWIHAYFARTGKLPDHFVVCAPPPGDDDGSWAPVHYVPTASRPARKASLPPAATNACISRARRRLSAADAAPPPSSLRAPHLDDPPILTLAISNDRTAITPMIYSSDSDRATTWTRRNMTR